MIGTVIQGKESAALIRLQSVVEGHVIVPGDAEYDAARAAWNLTIDQYPAVIVVANSIADVQAAAEYAKEMDLKIAVQTTGHGIPRHCDEAVLIRTGRLNYVVVDADRRTANVGGGAKWQDVLDISTKEGLAGLSGSAPHVGVVGYLLGGGYSIMSRKYGLGIDTVRSMKVVLADGSLVTASETENPDLFYAIRGGGGAFGIVVELEIDLIPLSHVFGGSVMYPFEMAAEIYPKYLEWTKTLPDDVTSAISLMRFPPAPFVPEPFRLKSFVIVTACVTDVERAEELLRPMREMEGVVADTFALFPYQESWAIYRDPVDPIPGSGNGVLFKDLTPESLSVLLNAVGSLEESAHLKFELRHLGGAIANADAVDSAVGDRREANYLLYMLGIPLPPNSPEAMIEQQDRIFAAMEDHILAPGPLNFIGEGHIPAERMKAVFHPETYERLREIKQARDPQNRFAFASLGFA